MKEFLIWTSIILTILGFIGIALFPPMFLFDELPDFLKKQSAGQSTSRKPSSRLRQTTVLQSWQQFISILESHDFDMDRSEALSDLKDRLPSRLSVGELDLIVESFGSGYYGSTVRSDLKDRLILH